MEPELYTAPKLYEVREGKTIRVGVPNGLHTFNAGTRIWLKAEEAAQHSEAIVLIYPPDKTIENA